MQILEWVKRQTGKLADNVKDYKFYVKSEHSFIDSSTNLMLTPYSNRDEIATIPCIFKWSRIKNGLISQVPEFKGNSFICEPSDIGCIIQAEITSTDLTHPGTAILKYGPVKLDVLVKKQLEHTLTSGSLIMNVDLMQGQDIKGAQIKVNEDTIRLSQWNSDHEYTFDYSMAEPRIEASIKESTKVIISFSEKYAADVSGFVNTVFGYQDITSSMKLSNEKRLELKFSSRAMKDNFLLAVKAFNTKKALKTSAVIEKIEKIDLSSDDVFDYVLQIESLRADLIKLARLNDKFQSDKRMCFEENRKLEKEIEEIIVTYTKIAQGKCRNQQQLDQSVMQLRQKRDQVMERKLHSLMRQNQNLKQKIEMANEEIAGRSMQLVDQKSIRANNSAIERSMFSKKASIPEVAANHFNQILQELNSSDVHSVHNESKSVNEQKSMLARELNKSVVKIAKLEQKIKQMKMNQTLNFNMGDISCISSENNRKVNMSAMDLGSHERQKFCLEIEELRKKNMKLKEQNYKLKSQIQVVSSQQERSNVGSNKSQMLEEKSVKEPSSRLQNSKVHYQEDDLKSQKSHVSSISLNPEQYIEKKLNKMIDQLTNENKSLKMEVEKLKLEKAEIQKEKQSLQQKYKKRVGDLSNQNSMYKRNQDALNRSQNLSMEMDSYNEEQNNLLKEQNEFLTNENLKINKLYEKAMDELKKVPKLKQEILRLTAELTLKRTEDLNLSKEQNSKLLMNE